MGQFPGRLGPPKDLNLAFSIHFVNNCPLFQVQVLGV